MNIKAYLTLARPANIVTSIADILAGVAIATMGSTQQIRVENVLLLALATMGLYGGGIVFNDIFDLKLDKIERPERVIPSGKISLKNATTFGTILLSIGILVAFLNNNISGIIAIIIAISALLYDKYGKHYNLFGPLNMGFCRGANLILGISIFAPEVAIYWPMGIIPIIYIAAITMISRGEVTGGSKNAILFAGILYLIVSFSQLCMAYNQNRLAFSILFIGLHLFLIIKPLVAAYQNPISSHIGKAVKAGVISLIIMDAAWISIAGHDFYAVALLCLLPVSFCLSKTFAVT